MNGEREHTGLTIAGHDPSGGAGILADAGVFATYGFRPLSVCTAVTVQNHSKFVSANWVSGKIILEQLRVLLKEEKPAFVKIGIIENSEVLKSVLLLLQDLLPETQITWDPVIKASAGAGLGAFKDDFNLLASLVDYITPNLSEAITLTGIEDPEKASLLLKTRTGGVIKSALLKEDSHYDLVFSNDHHKWLEHQNEGIDRHGTGCLFASTLACVLARGNTLQEAASKASEAVRNYRSYGKRLIKINHHELLN